MDTSRNPKGETQVHLRTCLANQYRAALAMLRQAIDACSDELWMDPGDRNACWQVAYHTLFFADYYMQRDEHDWIPRYEHGGFTQNPDCIPGPPQEDSDLPHMPEPYTRAECIEYANLVVTAIDETLAAQDLLAADSGFSWYAIPKIEHHMVNLRHIQHGAAQIADRVRRAMDTGVDWCGSKPSAE